MQGRDEPAHRLLDGAVLPARTPTLNDCEDNSTFGNPYQGTGVVLVNPPSNLPVKTEKLYTGSGTGGGCWTSQQVSGDSCP